MANSQVLILLITLIVHANCEVVEIRDGWLEGTVMQTRKGVQMDAFLRIPFAEPPIGNLRFQPPIQNRPWDGVLNATRFGPTCMQPRFISEFGRSEDCLHLNVFTKNLGSAELKPVIVYVHGGAFHTGSGTNHLPDYLLDRDIILVTINYRIGVFGFLALGIEEVTGNMGLKDQAMALKWVQRNIVYFGGDPNLVTLAGLSAGGHGVAANLLSEMSRGLFHRAIIMSGSITWQRGLQSNEVPRALLLAANLNCSTSDMNELYQCLNERTADEISEAGALNFDGCPVMPWIPVVEPDFGQERFFTDEPNNLLRDGKIERVPVITGITADEFVSPLRTIFRNNNTVRLLNENFTDFAPVCFNFRENDVNSAEDIAIALRNYYLPFEEIDSRSFNSLKLLLADGTIGYGVHRFTRFASLFTDVYYYKFTYIGRFSLFHFPRSKPYGAHHVDDIQYLFGSRGLWPRIHEHDPENFMVERMTRLWEQFAKFGDPHNSEDEFLEDLVWPKHDLVNEYFLDIGSEMVEKQGLYLERFSVWDNLEKYPINSKN